MGEFGGRVWIRPHPASNSQTGMENHGNMVKLLIGKVILTKYLQT